ncbi:ABC transporter permease [Mesorhizobium sp.]|uniref:ABC transporter permease n=1 Tax=Mesorhizobium sp. TaxID=1871066 RepID=UPI000FE83DC7|nr:ABC transporter permease [Mesorhizobium sp.]RWI87924.1 MAG: ABC transporter permease [Mesorhizobium sp.]
MSVEAIRMFRNRQNWKHVVLRYPALLTLGVVLVVWEAIIRMFGVPDYVAPAPSVVGVELFLQIPLLATNMVPTVLEALGGFFIGNFSAILLAIGMVRSHFVERCFYPIAVFIQSVPMLAIAPILVLLFGTGYTPKVTIAALICFFPTLVNMVRGLKSVNPQAYELMRILSASNAEILLKLRLPSSLPFLFAALKVTAPSAMIGAIVGEWIGSRYGLGALILEATYNFRAPLLYATILVATSIAMAMFGLVGLVERRIVRWRPSEVY